jgi:hypothetical protein
MDPFTGALILGGLNMAGGAMKANQAAKQRKAEADMRAAEIEASPWTGKAPTTQVATATPSVWGEMAGGAVNALGQTAELQKAGLFKAEDVAPAGLGPENPMMQSNVGGTPTLFGRTPQQKSMWNLAGKGFSFGNQQE